MFGDDVAHCARETQMQSLANTLANFQSVIGTSALNTFEPVVRSLQQVFETINNGFIAFNRLTREIPALSLVVQGLGSALTLLGAVAFANVIGRITGFGRQTEAVIMRKRQAKIEADRLSASIVSLGRNITVASAAMGRMATGPMTFLLTLFPRLTGMILANGVAARAMAGAMNLLGTAFRLMGGWVGIAITAFLVIPSLFTQASSQAQRFAQAIDEARTALDRSRAAFEENSSVVTNLSDELQQLRQQEQRLRESQEDTAGGQQALRARAAELVETYGELGLRLNSMTATYDEMVAAVNRLREAHILEGQAAAESLAISARGLYINSREQILGSRVGSLLGGGNESRGNQAFLELLGLANQRGANISDVQNVFARFPAFQETLRTGSNQQILEGAAQFSDELINSAITQIRRGLTDDLNDRRVQTVLDALIGLRGTINTLNASLLAVERAEQQVEVARADVSPEAAAIRAEAQALRSEFTRAFQAVQQNSSTDPRERERLFRETVIPITERMQRRYEELFGEGSTISPELQQALRQRGVATDLRFDDAEGRVFLEELKEQSVEISQSIVSIALRAAAGDIQASLRQLESNRNPEELEATAAQISTAVDRWAAARLRQFYLSLGFTDQEIAAGINTAGFTWSQRDGLNEVNNEIAERRRDAQAQIGNRRQRIETDMRNERISAISREVRNLDRSLRQVVENLPAGSGRATLDRVLIQQLALIDRLEELERERLRLEAQERNLDDETVRLRDQDIRADFDQRRFELQRRYEGQYRQGSSRTMQEAMGDIREILNEQYLSEAAREAQTFAATFRDTMLAAVDASNRGFQKFFYDVATGASSLGGAFRNLAVSILGSMLEVITSKIAQQFTSMIFDLAFAAFGSRPAASSSGGSFGGGFGNFSFTGGSRWHGGMIHAFGGRGITTRDTIPVLAADGEYILRQSAVSAIGRDKLDEINALGNRTISQSSAQMKPLEINMPPPATTNVWLVSEDQMPPMGPNDIIATVVNDGLRGGSVKKLIKSVVAGG